MVASGLPLRNGIRHAGEVGSLALHMLSLVKDFKIKHRPDKHLQLRIGAHTGKKYMSDDPSLTGNCYDNVYAAFLHV